MHNVPGLLPKKWSRCYEEVSDAPLGGEETNHDATHAGTGHPPAPARPRPTWREKEMTLGQVCQKLGVSEPIAAPLARATSTAASSGTTPGGSKELRPRTPASSCLVAELALDKQMLQGGGPKKVLTAAGRRRGGAPTSRRRSASPERRSRRLPRAGTAALARRSGGCSRKTKGKEGEARLVARTLLELVRKHRAPRLPADLGSFCVPGGLAGQPASGSTVCGGGRG